MADPPVTSRPLRTASVAALVLLVPAALAVVSGQVLLFPSLAPSAVLQAHSPTHPSARPWHVVVSHLVGAACAFGAVWLLRLGHTPSVFQLGTVSAARAVAAVGSVATAVALEVVLHADHAPAASTTLLVALGSFRPTMHDMALIVLGVLLVAVAGEVGRRFQLRDIECPAG